MNKEQVKQAHERAVFEHFLKAQGLSFEDKLIENRKPPEPDILYHFSSEEKVAFELVEICAEDMAKSGAQALKSGQSVFTYSADPSKRILKDKLKKNYQTKHSIELICYRGRTVSWDDLIIASIKHLDFDEGPFSKIWLLGKRLYQIYPNEIDVNSSE